ncbi:unnamed protein product [Rotaria sordida]|uniref:Uncharacterized protein n=1 Tax=Rotaria sordida TaxID=392033 RepID=A0A815SGJ4_9BILA|nr:unnamed protein product [Rotaria sordida]
MENDLEKTTQSKKPISEIEEHWNNEENEREIEEMQQVQDIPVIDKKSIMGTPWNFNMVFEQNFKRNGLQDASNYPKLEELKRCFEFIEIDGLKSLKWHSEVFVTENFIKTILSEDDKNEKYQTDYLKPVNMI